MGALRPIPMLAPGMGGPATRSVWSCYESHKEAGVAQTLQGGGMIKGLALPFRSGSACPWNGAISSRCLRGAGLRLGAGTGSESLVGLRNTSQLQACNTAMVQVLGGNIKYLLPISVPMAWCPQEGKSGSCIHYKGAQRAQVRFQIRTIGACRNSVMVG